MKLRRASDAPKYYGLIIDAFQLIFCLFNVLTIIPALHEWHAWCLAGSTRKPAGDAMQKAGEGAGYFGTLVSCFANLSP